MTHNDLAQMHKIDFSGIYNSFQLINYSRVARLLGWILIPKTNKQTNSQPSTESWKRKKNKIRGRNFYCFKFFVASVSKYIGQIWKLFHPQLDLLVWDRLKSDGTYASMS